MRFSVRVTGVTAALALALSSERVSAQECTTFCESSCSLTGDPEVNPFGPVPFKTTDEMVELYKINKDGSEFKVTAGTRDDGRIYNISFDGTLYTAAANCPDGAASPEMNAVKTWSDDSSLWLSILCTKPEKAHKSAGTFFSVYLTKQLQDVEGGSFEVMEKATGSTGACVKFKDSRRELQLQGSRLRGAGPINNSSSQGSRSFPMPAYIKASGVSKPTCRIECTAPSACSVTGDPHFLSFFKKRSTSFDERVSLYNYKGFEIFATTLNEGRMYTMNFGDEPGLTAAANCTQGQDSPHMLFRFRFPSGSYIWADIYCVKSHKPVHSPGGMIFFQADVVKRDVSNSIDATFKDLELAKGSTGDCLFGI